MKCPVCGTPWSMLDKSPAHPFGGWVTHCYCQHVLPGSPLYPPPCQHRWLRKDAYDLCVECGAKEYEKDYQASPQPHDGEGA